jgi:uncharacterized protein (TIGR02246 family)
MIRKGEISAMALPTTTQLEELLDKLANSWSAGKGQEFGTSFMDNAHFVAFDGTVLEGSAAIGQYHQAAFDRYLQNTKLVVSVNGTRAIDESALLVFASGGIQSKSGETVLLTGDSLQTMVVVLQGGKARVLAFQNTRRRPITDGDSASVWREFDSLWSHRHAKANV